MNQIFFIHLPVVHIQALSTEVHFLCTPFSPAAPLLTVCPTEARVCIHTKICTWMFPEVSPVIAKNWGQPRYAQMSRETGLYPSSGCHSPGKSLLPMIHGDGAQRQLLRPRRHTAGTYCEVACTWDARKCKFIPVTADHCSPRAGAVRRLQQRDFLEVFCVLIGGIVTWIYLSALWAL